MDTDKKLHVWLKCPNYIHILGKDIYDDYIDTKSAIERGDKVIHTTQPHFLRFRYGYRLFVHTDRNDANGHEITLGECEGTNKEIREAHNIEKMLFAGTFDWF